MQIEYVGRHLDITDEQREFTAGKLGKVLKFLEEPIEVRVTLEEEKHRQIADLHVSHRFGVLKGREESADWRESVLGAVDKVGKQARRTRKKFFDKRRRPATDGASLAWPVDVLERASMAAGTPPRVIRSSSINIEPMRIDEAAAQLESPEHPYGFFIFRDSGSDRVSVLYRRPDDTYGLISTEP